MHVKQSGSAWRFDLVELSGATRRDLELRQVVICDPSFVFRFRGVARLVFDGGSRAREAVWIRVAFRFG